MNTKPHIVYACQKSQSVGKMARTDIVVIVAQNWAIVSSLIGKTDQRFFNLTSTVVAMELIPIVKPPPMAVRIREVIPSTELHRS